MDQSYVDAAAAVEGVAQELEGIGRSGSAKMLRNAFDALLGVDEAADLPPADDATRRTVVQAWDRYRQGVGATEVADLKRENADLIARNFACGQQLEEMSDALMIAERDVSEAARDVLAERRRQIEVEGWTPEHDDAHNGGQLAAAAAAYATAGRQLDALGGPGPLWPWELQWWKPRSYRDNLVKAGALILAEIERLDRRRLQVSAGRENSETYEKALAIAEAAANRWDKFSDTAGVRWLTDAIMEFGALPRDDGRCMCAACRDARERTKPA